MMMGYNYTVKLTRRIKCPSFGTKAYRIQVIEKVFPFGKNKKFKNGKIALEEAKEFAKKMSSQASSVGVFRLTDQGNGSGFYVKNDYSEHFASGFGKEIVEECDGGR